MNEALPLNAAWRAANPLPPIAVGQDKHERGTVLAVGGSRRVPGALILSGTAALRTGAGKVQLATVDSATAAIGVRFPEAAVIGLAIDDEGEIALRTTDDFVTYVSRCDSLVFGPGMREQPQTSELVAAACGALPENAALVLDAGALTACRALASALRANRSRTVMTPHHGELARLLGVERDDVAAKPANYALQAADRFDAVIMLKDSRTFIAAPDGGLLVHNADVAGLGTAGSGDVLAGITGGLLARGLPAMAAAGWAVWLHAQAGRVVAEQIGALGFLARELLEPIPRLLEACSPRSDDCD
jgi:ADP-dependent NAD(P)H-hydrate dehydratase